MTTLLKSSTDTPTLDPGVDACACPDCGMPMSVRLWLRTADCYRCGTSIALEYVSLAPAKNKRKSNSKSKRSSNGQQQSQRQGNTQSQSASLAAPPRSSAAPSSGLATLATIETKEALLDEAPRIRITAPPLVQSRTQKLLRNLHQLLACLMSVLAHLLLLILLALLGWGSMPGEDPAIDLSVVFDQNERAGDLPLESILTEGADAPAEPVDPQQQQEAERWAKELAMEDPADTPNLPALDRVADRLESDDPYARMHSARDPRIRQQILEAEGGTNLTEAAVAKALRWMSLHQSRDGSWSLGRFNKTDSCRGRCGNGGSARSDEGATAMVLQAMLGAGQTHRTGIYQDTVSHGLQYLLNSQRPNGSLADDSSSNAGMYAHALATIALADAYALTGDELLSDPAQRAVNYIVGAQHSAGGWRYNPGQAGDLSITGWQLMALHSARAAGLRVEHSALERASRFLNQVQGDRRGSTYCYQPGHRPSPAMTAEGLLSRIYLGWTKDEPGLGQGIRQLAASHPVDVRRPNIYYWYYATQLFHHWGGREWRDWNQDMADALVGMQVQRGHAAGSWDPKTDHGSQGGRLYMTVLATCTLEVYYRHAPLFRKIKID